MSPRKVRRKYVRHLLVWGSILVFLVGLAAVLSLIWPNAWLLVVVIIAVLMIPVVLVGALFTVICTVLAVAHFIKTGYWTNPYRHGPWGDWKKEL